MPQDIVSDLTDIYLQQTREQINVSPAPARPLVRPTGVSSLILADQLTLFQPGRTDYAHLITNGTPRFADLPTALY